MVSKKISKNILQNLKKNLVALPPSYFAAALFTTFILPFNIASAEEVTEEHPTLVSPSEDNEGQLDYLVLDDYFITAERIPSHRLDTPANVKVITAEDIEANHYKSIEEILTHVTGVFGSLINGSDKTLLLVNGSRQNQWTPPIAMVERIEIVKGGGSALYGTDAVGGVINIVTKKGKENQTTLDAAFGSWKTRRYDISNQGVEGKLNWFAAGGLHSQHPAELAGSNAKGSDQDEHEAAINLGYDFTDRNSVNLYLVSGKASGGNYSPPRYKAEANQIAIGYDFKKGTSTPGFLKYFNNYLKRSIANPYLTLREQGVNYQNGWEFGAHKLIAGFEYYKISDREVYWNNDLRKFHNTAYYLQDTISIGSKFTLIPGVRYDNNSQFGHQWSPKLAANYRTDEKTKIFASWGKVYRAPNINELYGDDFIGNSRLKPESGHTETIGVEHDFSEGTTITASVFNTKLKDAIVPNADDNPTYFNARNKKYRGVEVDFQQKLNDNFKYSVGYAFTSGKTELGSGVGAYMDYPAPRNSFYLGLNYNDGPFKANLYGRVGRGINNKDFTDSYSYVVFDANASYDITDWATIYLKCNNLTDKNYGYRGDDNLRSQGRFFMAGAQFKF